MRKMHITKSDIDSIKADILNIATSIGIDKYTWLIHNVIYDEKFQLSPGSGNSKHHHCFECGLLVHTHEVIKTSLAIAKSFDYDINLQEVFFAALYHDSGKIGCYKINEKGEIDYDKTNHMFHHIPLSVIEWFKACHTIGADNEFYENVLHAIIAHHGCREHGSNVKPQSRVAWVVHLADIASARLNDFHIYNKD